MTRANGKHIIACHLGPMDYAPAWALQRRIQARLIAAKRSDPATTLPHVLLMVEHPPVYTLGKSGDASNLLLSEEALAAHGATFHRIDRGGDITFHGPGQFVGYPILDLDRFFTDIHRYLRELEEAVARTCADYGLDARRVEKRTGVWIGPDVRGLERKICAMGIRCSRWVTMHGFAFNLNTDLRFFDYIVPCGITDRGVTSLAAEVGHPIDEAEARGRFLAHFAARFGAEVELREGPSAHDFLAEMLAPESEATAGAPPASGRETARAENSLD
ncbi:MAG: lipoyl(octanoyl) transferase LipB [Rhodothermaceae bacterium]|nr:lipoyl(octanoyl) transferase LipB [Rhodothermaceae bacterium]